MRILTKHSWFLILAVACGLWLTGCDIDADRVICDYKVQLRYDYNEENGTQENRIEYYVYSIDEYIFDDRGVLFRYRQFTPDRCTEYMNSEIDLPPGRYSVIAIGNMDERSAATDAATGDRPLEGYTLRKNMRLTLANAAALPNNTYGPSEPLYHGYKTFTVKERGISRIRVDMINAHFTLKFRVRWKNGATPPTGDYYALLESVPSHYHLMPEYIYPAGSFTCETHDPGRHDLYPDNCNNVIHHIPGTCHEGQNVLVHRHDTHVTVDKELWGEFTAYRIKDATAPKLRVFGADDTQVIRDIDLQQYFQWYDYRLDTELKQAYSIDITVDGDKIILMPLEVGDYEEGGQVTGTT